LTRKEVFLRRERAYQKRNQKDRLPEKTSFRKGKKTRVEEERSKKPAAQERGGGRSEAENLKRRENPFQGLSFSYKVRPGGRREDRTKPEGRGR